MSGLKFEDYQSRYVFAPLGMTQSAWRVADLHGRQPISSRIRVADGNGGFSFQRTPVFDLGTLPAGNLYTTAPDLAELLFMLDGQGVGRRGRVLSAGSLEEMTHPQLEASAGFGLGFALGKFREHKTIGHTGAVYGHSTSLAYLPDTRIGVIVLANEDIVNARVGRIANEALSLLLELKSGEVPSPTLVDTQLPTGLPTAFEGAYESQSYWAELRVENGRLEGNYSTQPCHLTRVGLDRFRLSSRIHNDAAVVFSRSDAGQITGFSVGVQKFARVPNSLPRLPESWKPLLGSYGPKVIPLVVHEKFGHLYATTENMVDYRLQPMNRNVFLMPTGMYEDEHLVFLTKGPSRPHSVNFANMILHRLR